MNKAFYLMMITLASVAVAQPHFNPQNMNQHMDKRNDMSIKPRVSIWTDQHEKSQRGYSPSEDIHFYVRSNLNSYIYLFHVNSKGQVKLLPSDHYPNNRTYSYLRANTIKRFSHINRVTKSLGMNKVFVVASGKRLYPETIDHLTSISFDSFSNTLKSLTYQGILTTDMTQYQIMRSAQPRKMDFIDFAAQNNVFLYGFGKTKWVTACHMSVYQSSDDFNHDRTKKCLWHAPKGWVIVDTKVNVLNNIHQNVSWSSDVRETTDQYNGLQQQVNKINNLMYISNQQGKKDHAFYFKNIRRHILRERSKYAPNQNSFLLTVTANSRTRKPSKIHVQGKVKLMKIE